MRISKNFGLLLENQNCLRIVLEIEDFRKNQQGWNGWPSNII
jgi:hypothetical protein